MTTPFTRAPHQGSSIPAQPGAPNAALLIDFDNVTMGMRSDLSKDLKKLLQSDIIKGKVTVQRAYADWRRYPQYIVPLSENSIDLIFAPAYGSSKKNATDIRMAIDGMELVFTRPEIGTYILLTGDSDFSSLVLKLKEYGKYVIGVGIQESSSDILVQNCDEYYSYTNLAGLQKTNETDQKAMDPWVLVERAVKRMAERDDVMRSDRLKQVMVELDPAFNEGNFGYSKFSRFLTQAASRRLVQLRKLENGQYEVAPMNGGGSDGAGSSGSGRGRGERDRERERDRRGRRGERGREPRAAVEETEERAEAPRSQEAPPPPSAGEEGLDPLQAAYTLLTRALELMKEDGREAVRDSDVKRKLLELDPSFDEAELGFGKFSRFLRQAHDHEVVDLQKGDGGNYHVSLRGQAVGGGSTRAPDGGEAGAVEEEVPPARESEEDRERHDGRGEDVSMEGGSGTGPGEPSRKSVGPRRGSTRRRHSAEPPPLLEGQVVPLGSPAESGPDRISSEGGTAASSDVDPTTLGLPTGRDAAVRYLSNSYRGVGAKTAEALVDAFGDDLFGVLHSDPARINSVVPPARAEAVIEAWREDYRRRSASLVAGTKLPVEEAPARRTRRTRRGRRS